MGEHVYDLSEISIDTYLDAGLLRYHTRNRIGRLVRCFHCTHHRLPESSEPTTRDATAEQPSSAVL